jgi:sialate O-acetylesterase
MKRFNTFIYLIMLIPSFTTANIKLPGLVSNGMVLQRNKTVHIWGWASADELVSVTFNGQTIKAKVKDDKRWDVYLSPMQAGGPYDMVVKGNNTIKLINILIGDVWLCSGQSNMEYQLFKSAQLFPDDIINAGRYRIREFAVKNPHNFKAKQQAIGSWKQADSITVLNFSAVGFFFAQSLCQTYNVPIGIINASYPGSPAEAWISENGLSEFPYYLKKANTYKDSAYAQSVIKKDKAITANWLAALKQNDQGLLNGKAVWSNPADASGWRPMVVPGYWEEHGAVNVDGVVWIKKNVEVNERLLKGDVFIELGLIADIDSTYINGQCIGSKDNKYLVRRYKVPEGILHLGNNTIVVRIINKEGGGGIVPGKQYRLTNGQQSVELSGAWLYKIGCAVDALSSRSFTRMEFMPTIQYHSRLEPIVGYTLKGVAWYQGESNTQKASEYYKLLQSLINNWRTKWQQPNLPFLIVQLPNYHDPTAKPGTSNWAVLREAQARAAQIMPSCRLVIIIDAGEADDIHPPDKKTVGKRLGLAARSVAYNNTKVIASGPVYQSLRIDENKIILSFDNNGSLVARGGTLNQFAIAGADKLFYPGRAQIIKGKVIVSNDNVPHPVAVRYAWANNPQGCNLYNTAGLPAAPFRTDSWDF